MSYEDALDCTGLETLSSRRHNSCVKFISKLRSEEVLDYNPLAHIVTTQPQHFDHNYYLRTQPITKFITNTERFRNFVTAKYYWCIYVLGLHIFTLYYVIRIILTLYRVIQFNTAIRVIKQIIIIIIIIILINLDRSVFTVKYQTSAKLYWARYRLVNTARLGLIFYRKDRTVEVNK